MDSSKFEGLVVNPFYARQKCLVSQRTLMPLIVSEASSHVQFQELRVYLFLKVFASDECSQSSNSMGSMFVIVVSPKYKMTTDSIGRSD